MNTTEELTLNKENPLLPAEDFDNLRREGIKQIEKLSGEMWTEYNTSDPGITILEAVNYAITDLAYRTGFEMKDLLAPKNFSSDTWNKVFYTARQILHTNPLTIHDIRKVLIDIEGVRNAWVEMSKDYEVPIHIHADSKSQHPHSDCGCKDDHPCRGELSVFGSGMKTKILEIEGLYNVIVEYEEDILEENHREEIRERVLQRLHYHRNLCEDFISVNSVVYEDFSVMGLFVIKEDANPEEVFAKVCFEIYKYFSPSITFYTIDQLIQKTNTETGQLFTVDEIFEGPALKHGFIDTADLENTNIFRDFRLSDLINIIHDIDEIVAIPNLYLPFDATQNPLNDLDDISLYFNDWIRLLRQQRKVARLAYKESKFIFLKNNDVTTYDFTKEDPRQNRAVRRFEDLKTQEQKYKLKGHPTDFDVPLGENMDLEDYFPVQYSLPNCYGVSEFEELPGKPATLRDIQAYQLKGYLMFFEQILVNYHAQLNNLNSIFSFDETVEHTYFIHVLHEINNLKELIVDHTPLLQESSENFFEEFTKILQHLIEPNEVFLKRRNKFLDHLLARFNEDQFEYDALTRLVWKTETDKKLIDDKIRLLQDYIKVSKNRGKGLNYLMAEHVWDTQNVTGVERRIGRLLGFPSIERRSLTSASIRIEELKEEFKDKKKRVIIILQNVGDSKEVLLTSRPIVDDDCCIDQTLNLILELAENKKNYRINGKVKSISRNKSKQPTGIFRFELIDNEGDIVAVGEEFSTQDTVEKNIKRTISQVQAINQNEGMHVIEHLLLRPKLDTVLEYADCNPKDDIVPPEVKIKLLNICLDDCDTSKGIEENIDKHPYRIKISRLPAEKCYKDEAWVLQLIRVEALNKSIIQNKKKKAVTLPAQLSPPSNGVLCKTLDNKVGNNLRTQDLLAYKRYDLLNDALADLREFGSEITNYKIMSYSDNVADDTKRENILYHFEILDRERKRVIARSINYDDIEEAKLEIEAMVKYLGFQLDLYCDENPCDHNEDPYSFRASVVLPCWIKRFRDKNYRHFVEKTIHSEFPAHIAPRIYWIGIREMHVFEEKYKAWLEEFLNNPYPEYQPVNDFVDLLNTIKECGQCEPNTSCIDMPEQSSYYGKYE
ncbi:MAG: hypothetical protein ACRCVT_14660 [Leadbetterella sp.]